MTYLLSTGPPIVRDYTVLPDRRRTIWVDVEEPLLASADVAAHIESDVPIVVERAMYLSGAGRFWRAGHESAGLTQTATSWFFAEGATGPYFDLFVLLANPDSADAEVEITFLLPDGTPVVTPYAVPAQSRRTLWVDLLDERLADAAVSVLVSVTNGIGIVAERAMWWPGRADTWTEAHGSQGSTNASPRWTVADGEQGGPQAAETYLLVADTADAAGQATVTLLLDDGTTRTKGFAPGPRSRTNVAVGREFPDVHGHRFGAIVESDGAIRLDLVVERASYWDGGAERWGAGTSTLAMPDTVAEVTVDLLPDGVSPGAIEIAVGSRIRFVNRTERDMFIATDPHPGHFFCRAMDPVGRLGPGQSAVSGPFLLEQTCTLHEHLQYDPRHHATVVVRW